MGAECAGPPHVDILVIFAETKSTSGKAKQEFELRLFEEGLLSLALSR